MRKTLVTAIAALAIAGGVSTAAHAAKYKAIHDFCTQTDCTDGKQLWAPPVTDGNGNYYGATGQGGAKDMGTIYRMRFQGGHWHYTRLYSLCADKDCTGGAHGQSPLIIDADGNLYGVTAAGGNDSQWGTIFELSPGAGDKWTYKVLHTFCAKADCADGGQPVMAGLSYQGQASGLAYDGTSPLYGATTAGGTQNAGTVYSLTPNAAKTKWTKKVLHNFCALNACADGAGPYSGPMIDGMGHLFGVTTTGGAYTKGVLYELSPAGAKWKHVVLHSFCADQTLTCADGSQLLSPPIMDGQGFLYGTTFVGGVYGAGTVWKLVPNGTHSKLTVLHSFCREDGCPDGSVPWSSLMFDADNHLIGTTLQGGAMNKGAIFKLAGAKHDMFTRLFSFGTPEAQGASPVGGLMMDQTGALYGTTTAGGANDGGVFYRLTP